MKPLTKLQQQADLHLQCAALHKELSGLQWRRLTSGWPTASTVLPLAALGLLGARVARSSSSTKNQEEARTASVLERITEQLQNLDATFAEPIDKLHAAADELEAQTEPTEVSSNPHVLTSALVSILTRLVFTEVQPLYTSLKSSVVDLVGAQSQSADIAMAGSRTASSFSDTKIS